MLAPLVIGTCLKTVHPRRHDYISVICWELFYVMAGTSLHGFHVMTPKWYSPELFYVMANPTNHTLQFHPSVISRPSKWTRRVWVANCCWPPPPPRATLGKSRLWVLWQHLTKYQPCKHFRALSMLALQREAAWAEERLLSHLYPVGRPPPTRAVTGKICLCLCAFSFPELSWVPYQTHGRKRAEYCFSGVPLRWGSLRCKSKFWARNFKFRARDVHPTISQAQVPLRRGSLRYGAK